jgi:hydrogenase maturation protease
MPKNPSSNALRSGGLQPGTLDSMTCPPKGGLYEKQQRILQHPGPNVSPGASRLLIVGCGNPAAGDDSAGVEILRRLSDLGGCGCELRAETGPGVGLLDLLPIADVILFVDAVTSGGIPGTLYLTSLPCKDLEPRALGSLSGHGWGLVEILKLANALGRTLPRLVLLGIEAGTVTQGAPRSAVVEQAIALVVERMPDLKFLLQSSEIIGTQTFSPDDRSFPGDAAGPSSEGWLRGDEKAGPVSF